MKRVAVYCRVSTNEEGQQLSLENQKRLISKDKSYQMIDSVIVDGEIININHH